MHPTGQTGLNKVRMIPKKVIKTLKLNSRIFMIRLEIEEGYCLPLSAYYFLRFLLEILFATITARIVAIG